MLPLKHPDSWTEFSEWIEKFKAHHGGFFPYDTERWWKECEESHKDLRGFLGGIRREAVYNLKSQQNAVSKKEAKPIIDNLLAFAPGYLQDYGFTDDVFLLPYIQQGTHQAFKTGKHFKTYAEMRTSNPAFLKEIDKLLASLGELWARARVSDTQLEITLSTSPKSFVLMGHYGPDSDSCFRNGSDKTADKFVVGQTENTFTISISKARPGKKNLNVARCFGFFDSEFKSASICNYYNSPGFLEGDGLEVIRLLLQELWQDDVSFHEDKVMILHGKPYHKDLGIYHNPYGNWAFSKGKNSSYPEQNLVPNTHLIKTFICPYCGINQVGRIMSPAAGWSQVDDLYVCKRCVGVSNVCEVSGRRTFQPLVEVLNADNDTAMAHPEVAAEMKKCELCKKPHTVSIDIEGKVICDECLECRYTECENCQELRPDSEMSNLGDLDVCKACVTTGALPFDSADIHEIMEILDLISEAETEEHEVGA